MTPEKWQKIDQLFHSALAVEVAERDDFVRRESRGDEEVFAEVAKLLSAHQESGDFISEPVVPDLVKIISSGNGGPKREVLDAGDVIGHYVVREKLGKGGMGEVYLCRDKNLSRDVAIKILLPEFTRDGDRVKRFQREAKAASALNHPHILTIYEIGQADEMRFIVTEYVKGRTLADALRSEKLSLSEILKIAKQICSALSVAHEAGIIHRDIKPDNVMIRDDGIVKVLDFGLAKLAESNTTRTEQATLLKSISHDSTRTTPGMIMGTPDYMSPEQARGKPVDAQTDIFSFGVLLYQMLTGVRPFEGETMSDVIAAVLTKEPRPLTEISPAIPPELDRIVDRSLKKDKHERYKTADEMLTDLTELLDDLKAQDRIERSIVPNSDDAKTVAFRPTTVDGNAETVATAANITQNPRSLTKYLAFAAAAILLSIAAFFGYQYLLPPRQIESIAVMPFVNESGNPDLEYLSDGMTETLIKSISGIPNLNVKARSTVFRYKGQQPDINKIASELGVQAVVTGRVVQRNDEIILSLDLVEAATEKNLWNERYTRKQSDIVSLQNEIARDVSQNLQARLTGDETAKIANSGTANSEAYQAYLRGRYFLAKGTLEAPEQALKHFQEAVALDPKFARAYAGIADCYSLRGTLMQLQKADDMLPPAKLAAEKAIELDPNLSEAYVSLAWIKFRYDWDWTGSERDFKKALELDPNNAQAHQWYGELLACLRRDDEAIAEFKKARDLEPFNLLMNWNLAKGYHDMGRYDEAIVEARKIYEMDRNFRRNYRILRQAYERKKMFAEAFRFTVEEMELNKTPRERIDTYTQIYSTSGYEAAHRYTLERDLKENKNLTASIRAVYYRGLGDKDNMFAAYEEAYKKRESGLLYIKIGNDFVKDDPRFIDLVRRMNFPG